MSDPDPGIQGGPSGCAARCGGVVLLAQRPGGTERGLSEDIWDLAASTSMADDTPIASLLPRGSGHQFVIYGDSCSGVPGGRHEVTFAAVNGVVARLVPPPEFIIFPGDEIIGLAPDRDALMRQWRHFLDAEMAWLDRGRIPVWHCTGNHTTYDRMSEAVFAEVLGMPRNGPPGQEGLSFFVRRGDLLLVFVHTLWSGLGGEGHVETEWLDEVLAAHADARHKLVVGHHPVFPVNGFSGAYQREIGPEHAAVFWGILVQHGVLAYVCSHILAFDVQVHEGVLQILTAGAGTAHRMPEGIEYLHAMQVALDTVGLRYQVLDAEGHRREALAWPLAEPDAAAWARLPGGRRAAPFQASAGQAPAVRFRVSGMSGFAAGEAETLLATLPDGALPALWIGVAGPLRRLIVVLAAAPGRSPHAWIGPSLPAGMGFDFELLLHPGMGPGGVLHRYGAGPWSSLAGASAWGCERLAWPAAWAVGHAHGGPGDRPFKGPQLDVAWAAMPETSVGG